MSAKSLCDCIRAASSLLIIVIHLSSRAETSMPARPQLQCRILSEFTQHHRYIINKSYQLEDYSEKDEIYIDTM
ncbi:unnamed protein product [Lasius platythorax]|uniref:Secreted protein n=1 Tax=Lasius platythorax TaxID=488582 RepID=A0AAV2P6G9_9HYME